MCVDCCLDEYYYMYSLFWLVDLAVASKLVATAATNPALQLV